MSQTQPPTSYPPGHVPSPGVGSLSFIQPTVMHTYGPNPQNVVCPSCRCQVTTRVETEPTSSTHIIAILLGCMCCLCCIPYCIDTCQNINHYCQSCGAYLGTYSN